MKGLTLLIILFIVFQCNGISSEPENKLEILVPRYKEATTPREDNFAHILNRLGIKERPVVTEAKGDKIIKTKFKSFDLEIKEYRREPSRAVGLYVNFFHPSLKKGKTFISYFDGQYSESNYCYAYTSVYSSQGNPPPKWGYYECGRSLEVDISAKYINEKCWDVKEDEYIDKSKHPIIREDCRDEATIRLDGKESKTKPNLDPSSCPHKCYDLIPYMEMGEYVARKTGVIVRDTPSRKGKLVTKLEKDMNVTVTEDTGKIEEIEENIAPWVKVKLRDGKEGYVFGIFLKRPGEFWP
ncbi:SH3 domain-containing protein [Leptospira ilyithenensis]|uniref:SH3 domain-containing protein n=1 Tax=Leptospira ilyithenensis TaxID=2484901 RepID=A0A4R9LTX4_9LEPT|nr:SH3 domain-containing protein [Leptospira ilyithenensis]TGN14031.1 SH3 domain-containing protein [Leptospira ilyithenensis]